MTGKDGKDKAVTYSNREDFVRLYCEWLLTESASLSSLARMIGVSRYGHPKTLKPLRDRAYKV